MNRAGIAHPKLEDFAHASHFHSFFAMSREQGRGGGGVGIGLLRDLNSREFVREERLFKTMCISNSTLLKALMLGEKNTSVHVLRASLVIAYSTYTVMSGSND